MAPPLLEIEDLTIRYETPKGMLSAVSDVSFTIEEGEYFGLVGESGCGKSTIVDAIMGDLPSNGEVVTGSIRYRGREIQDLSDGELNNTIRWKEISWIPQGSMNSLDPLQRVSDQAVEIAKTHTDLTNDEALDRFRELFSVVGLPENRIHDYPHQFSGGMQQRALIAIALFLEPSLFVADEPTTALDVIMQNQIFKYLDQIKDELNTSMMLVTHDISLVFESCRSMAVMHSGQLAERGPVEELFDAPRHPYSILLQRAFPDIRRPDQQLEIIDGYPPQVYGDADYCTFVDRCPWAVEECGETAPPDEAVGRKGSHAAACFRADEAYQLYEAEKEQGGGT